MAFKLRVWLLAALVLLAAVALPALAQETEESGGEVASTDESVADPSTEESGAADASTEESGVADASTEESVADDASDTSTEESADADAAAAASEEAEEESSGETQVADSTEEQEPEQESSEDASSEEDAPATSDEAEESSEETADDVAAGLDADEEVDEEANTDDAAVSAEESSEEASGAASNSTEAAASGGGNSTEGVDASGSAASNATVEASGAASGGDNSTEEVDASGAAASNATDSDSEDLDEAAVSSGEGMGLDSTDSSESTEESVEDDSSEEAAEADPEGEDADGLAEEGDESSSESAASVDVIVRNGTVPPHATTAYTNRSEYKGFEYGGPVVHARHAVLDTKAKCSVFGNPATAFTFDSRGYAFRGMGAFTLARVIGTQAEVQVLETRTPLPQAVPRVVGVAFRSPGGQVIQVRLARSPSSPGTEASLQPYITLQGKDVTKEVRTQPRLVVDTFEITRDGVFGAANGKPMIMAVRSVEAGLTVAVTFERTAGVHHLNVFVEADGALLGHVEGLCGPYDFNPGNDLEATASASGVRVASASRTARRWVVAKAADALFDGYAPPSETPVVDESLQPSHMHATAADTAAAERACASLRKDFRLPCVMSALVAGAEGVAETKGAQDILLENEVVATPNITACLADFFVGPWSPFSQCDAACGAGSVNRTREVYSGQTREQCGTFTQYRKCTTRCEHADMPGKCAVYGDPHVVTFDQRMYDFRGVGEYVMYHSLDDKEQVNIVLDRAITNLTAQVSWATGVAFRVGPDVLSMHMADPSDDFCSFRYNGRALGGLGRNTSYYGLFTVRRSGSLAGSSRNNLLVEVSAPGGTTVTAAFYSFGGVVSLMNVFLQVGGQRLKGTQGMCGSFDLESKNDLTDVNGNAVSPREFAWGWGVARNRTLFADPTPPLALPASKLPLAPRLLGANGTYELAVNACSVAHEALRAACVIDYVTLGPRALDMIKDVSAVVEEDKIEVEYVARGCLVKEGSYLGEWGEWAECSRECNGGETTRTRGVFAYNSERCGTESERRTCNDQPCPIDCEVGSWRHWSECSVTCGNGTQTRTRGITVQAAHGGDSCPALSEDKPCARLPCCEVGEWGDFGSCRPDGTKVRRREVNYPSRCGKTTDTAECCYADPWPVSSHTVNGTGAKGIGGRPLWSECRDGEQVRKRRVFPEHCAEDVQRRPCCDTGSWSEWGHCTDGQQTRWRTVSPNNCSHSSETRVCCTRYAWSGWSQCQAGKHNRTRQVLPAGCDSVHEEEDCCAFGEWKAAQNGCVRGVQKFLRTVEPSDCGKAEEERPCCWTGEWKQWGECSTNGTQTRDREVLGPAGCAPANETRSCGERAKSEAAAGGAAGCAQGAPCVCKPGPCDSSSSSGEAVAAVVAQAPAAAAAQQGVTAMRPVLDTNEVRPHVVKAGSLSK